MRPPRWSSSTRTALTSTTGLGEVKGLKGTAMKKLPRESIDHGFFRNIFSGPDGFCWNKRWEIRWRFPLKFPNPFHGKHGGSPMVIHQWWLTNGVFLEGIHSIVRLDWPSHVCWKNCAEFPCRYGLGWLRPSDEEDGRSISSRTARQDPGRTGWT